MPDNVNPFIPGQAVDNPDLFFGRRDLLVSIGEHLVKGRRVFLVAGGPRLGKSSLLRQIPHHLPADLLCVRLDLVEESARKLDWLLWRVAGALLSGVPAPAWSDFQGNTDRLLDEFWPQARLALGDRCLVLLVDDVDVLASAPDALLDRFLAVLAAWRERESQFALVLTCSPAMQETLLRGHPQLLAGALTYHLGPLNSEEGTRLITWPVDGGLTYDYGVPRRIMEITSGQPFYLHLLGFELYNRCAAAGWVSLRDVDLVVEDLVTRESADFRQVWAEASAPEQAVLAALVSLRGARGVATIQEVRTILTKAGARPDRGHVAAALESLAARGILERLGALSYRFRVALLRDWLAERVDLEQVARSTRWDSERARSAGDKQVTRLAPARHRRAPAAEHPPAAATAAAAAEDAGPAPVSGPRWQRWWVIAVALLAIGVLASLGLLLWGGAPAPTPTPTVRPVAAATQGTGLAVATLTQAVVVVSYTATPFESPTITATPSPTFTPSPTPPIVLARSLPAIAYQSRDKDDSSWSIYVMNSDGSNRTLVSAGQSGFLAPPTWSPNGSQLVFVSDQGDSVDLWRSDVDGSNLVQLTQDEAKDHSPAWSPDGQWIVFASLRDALYWELYLMPADGSDVQRLTWWEDASDLAPTWAPDGSRLAFATKRDGNWEIYVMDRDGSNLVRLTNHPADDTNPAWSPDGSRIAFESTREGYAEIMVVSVTGGLPTNLSKAPYSSEHGPTWSPDGGRLAYYSDADGEWDIYVMASDGSNVTKLTGDDTNDQVPAWRP